jgi:AraC family transcriptional regulator
MWIAPVLIGLISGVVMSAHWPSLLATSQWRIGMSQTAAKQTPGIKLEPPRVENGKPLLIAGLQKSYAPAAMRDIPAQWQTFAPRMGKIPGQIGRTAYGVCWQAADNQNIEYLSGVEISTFTGVPEDFTVVSLPALKYAVFPHRAHVSKLYETCDAISRWLPESGYQSAAADLETPAFFERYSEEFDPQTGMGGMEVWAPLKS